jgi:hypothetical protein
MHNFTLLPQSAPRGLTSPWRRTIARWAWQIVRLAAAVFARRALRRLLEFLF